MNPDVTCVIGFDCSLQCPAMVALHVVAGKLIGMRYCTSVKREADDVVGIYARPRREATKLQVKEEKHNYTMRRGAIINTAFTDFYMKMLAHPDVDKIYVAIEGYGFASQSPGLMELAEVVGYVKSLLYTLGSPYRIYDPNTVKLWATGSGSAKKLHMVNAAKEKGFDPGDEMFKPGNKFEHPIWFNDESYTHDIGGPGSDLCDAFHLANMLRCELLLDAGDIELQDLTEVVQKQLTKFSKANPVPLIDRPFVLSTVLYLKEQEDAKHN